MPAGVAPAAQKSDKQVFAAEGADGTILAGGGRELQVGRC